MDTTLTRQDAAAGPQTGAAAAARRPFLQRIAGEPLLHFLLVGALLFGAYVWMNGDDGEAPRAIRIGVADVNWLKETWSRQWQRPPTEQEMRGLVREYLKESLLAREAMEMGLDEDDTVIRRRLAQKLEFLVQDTARLGDPPEEELRQYHAAHGDRYAAPAWISFSQVQYATEAAAAEALSGLAAGGPEPAGDAGVFDRQYANADPLDVGNQFGQDFARAVFDLEPGTWQGPVPSAYGVHLVRVDAREAGQPRPFEEVSAQVRDDWLRAQQEEAVRRFHAELLDKYEVVADESIRHLLDRPAEPAP